DDHQHDAARKEQEDESATVPAALPERLPGVHGCGGEIAWSALAERGREPPGLDARYVQRLEHRRELAAASDCPLLPGARCTCRHPAGPAEGDMDGPDGRLDGLPWLAHSQASNGRSAAPLSPAEPWHATV